MALYGDESFFRARNSFSSATLQHFRDRFTAGLVRHFESHETVAIWLEEHEGQGPKLPMSEGPVLIANFKGADTFSIGRSTFQCVDVAIPKMLDGALRLEDIRFDPERFDDLTLRKRIALDH